MLQEMMAKAMKPIIAEVAEESYKRGAEDILRRFAFVYDAVRQTAKADALAEIAGIDIPELDEQLSQKVFDEVGA